MSANFNADLVSAFNVLNSPKLNDKIPDVYIESAKARICRWIKSNQFPTDFHPGSPRWGGGAA
jgi:hypothetical protein